ncbi:MAG: RusA family crossover junction endodeoxyribonuclease [Candidatus Coproplasma sp.]
MITFIVKGKPQGKARARTFYNKRMGKMQSITPEQTKSYEDLIRWSYKASGGQYLGEKTLQVDIQAFYPIPQSFSKVKRRDAMIDIIRPTTKPDCDNIIKVVLDALNGVAYYDDKQVVNVSCNKYYGKSGYLEITLSEI